MGRDEAMGNVVPSGRAALPCVERLGSCSGLSRHRFLDAVCDGQRCSAGQAQGGRFASLSSWTQKSSGAACWAVALSAAQPVSTGWGSCPGVDTRSM